MPDISSVPIPYSKHHTVYVPIKHKGTLFTNHSTIRCTEEVKLSPEYIDPLAVKTV